MEQIESRYVLRPAEAGFEILSGHSILYDEQS